MHSPSHKSETKDETNISHLLLCDNQLHKRDNISQVVLGNSLMELLWNCVSLDYTHVDSIIGKTHIKNYILMHMNLPYMNRITQT